MKITYSEHNDEKTLINEITKSVIEEKVIGLFNGRMEFGTKSSRRKKYNRRSKINKNAKEHEPKNKNIEKALGHLLQQF